MPETTPHRASGPCTVSIVIPLFNKVELTRQCWKSIVEHTGSALAYEVVFVDNASTDATAHFLAQELASAPVPVTVLRNAVNLGFAKACNQAAKASRGAVVVFLNNDTLVHAGWLAPLVEELAANERAGVVGARLLYPDGSIQHAGVGINRRHIPYHLFLRAGFNDPLVTQRRAFRIVTGACMAVRKEQFLELGAFDEGYINGHEDVDLCLRYGQAGLQAIYRPDCVVTHFESQTEGRFSHCRENTDRTLLRWHGKLIQDDFNYAFPESERALPARALAIAVKADAAPGGEPGAAAAQAETLARELCRRGHGCQIHHSKDWGLEDRDADVVIVLAGRRRYAPKPYSRTLLVLQDEAALSRLAPDLPRYQGVVCPARLVAAVRTLAPACAVLGAEPLGESAPAQDIDALETALLALAAASTPPASAPAPRKVSILMATYNRRELLPRAIASILAQTMPAWELIIVNDGGDSVADIVSGFNDDRIIYRDAEHRSKGQAVNTAFSLSTGEYIAYLDDDDLWFPEHLERALFFLQNVPGVAMTYSDMVETTITTAQDGQTETVRRCPYQSGQVSFADLLECNCIPGITVVHTRELFEQTGGMDPDLQVLIDFDLWRRLAMRTEPYHISALTAEHHLRRACAPCTAGPPEQITALAATDLRRYLANACRVLRKKLPASMPEAVKKEQDAVRRKVQALFLGAQGDHFSARGDHRRAAACHKLAGRVSLRLCRELTKALYHA